MPEIKTKLVLEGEAQYSTAIKNATKAIKGLDAEQKLAQAQFNLTGDKEQYMADRAEILRKKIAEQEKAVKAAEEAVEKLRKMGVEPTNSKMQHWNEQLMKSKTELLKLQGSLANTEKGLTDSGTAFMSAAQKAEEYKDKTSDIATGINWQNTITAINSVSGALDTALSKIQNVVSGINTAMREAASWADDVLTSAAVASLDPETYQSWQYASEMMDVGVSDIVTAQARLLKAMTSDSKDTQELFNRLGVTTRTEAGNLRDLNDVFWDVVDAMSATSDAHGDLMTDTRRDAVAQELFGNSFAKFRPLFANGGRSAWEAYAEEGLNVATVSEENMEALGKLDDTITSLDARVNTLKMTVAAQLAPAFTDAASAAGELVTGLQRFVETEEGQQALANLNDAISELFHVFDGIDWNQAFELAAEAVRKLTDVLGWVVDHKKLVLGALIAIKGVAKAIKIGGGVMKMLQLIKSIEWLNVAKGASGLANAGGAGANGAAQATGTGLGAKAASVLSKMAPVAPWLTLAAVTGATAVTLDKGAVSRDWGEFNALQAQMPELMAASADASIQKMQEIMDAFNASMHDDFWGIDVAQIKQDFAKNANEILSALPNIGFWDRVGEMVDLSDGLDADEIEKIINSDSLLGQDWEFLGRDVVTGMANGVSSGVAPESESGTALSNAGKQIDTNIAAGIDAQAQTVVDAANRLASQIAGILGGIGAAGIDYGSIISSTIHAPAVSPVYGRTSGRGRGGASNGGTANVVLVMDKQTVARAVVPIVSDTFAADLQSRR
jgi:hypothetical protein